MKISVFSFVKLLLGWPLVIVAFFFISRKISPSIATITSHIETLHILPLLVSGLCFLGYFLIRGYVWQLLLQEKGYTIPFIENLYVWAVSEIKRFVPGSIWAFLSRANGFSNKEIKKSTIISCMIIELELVGIAAAIASLIALPLIRDTFFSHIAGPLIVILVTLVLLVSICFVAGRKLFGTDLPRGIRAILPLFSISTNLILLGLTTLAFLCFGIGTFLSITALIPLPLSHIIPLIGYFVFSFLVGYLSIIVPLGLGIREGVMTLGLATVISVTNAGIGAIFTRIVFTIIEVLFVCMIIFLHKSKKLVR